MSKLQAIRYERGKLELLDQRLLPLESIYILVRTPQEAFDAIRSMVVRGAPAIGCTAALAVAAWLVERGAGSQYDSAAAAADDVQATTDHLVQRCAAYARQHGLLAVSVLDAVRSAASTSVCRGCVCMGGDARLSFVSCCMARLVPPGCACNSSGIVRLQSLPRERS